MVERKIIWTNNARIKLYAILDFYIKRNKSKRYSEKLFKLFNKELKLLRKHPEIGIMTDYQSIRGLIVKDFIIYYEMTNAEIIVHTLWDCRQNPESLTIK